MALCPPCWTDMLEKILATLCGKTRDEPDEETKNDGDVMKIKGTLVLMKKSDGFLDHVYELFGKGVFLQLISAVVCDPGHGSRGVLGREAFLGKKNSTRKTSTEATNDQDVTFNVEFDWDESWGFPGAFIIRNNNLSEFYLKGLTLEDVPGHGGLHFICNSWIYPDFRYQYDRVFFANKPYLPCDTPEALRPYREEEINNLRGNGFGMLQEWDRVYDYAYYNDLGSPEKGVEYARPVLGGSEDYPYPRRGRTGRPPNREDKSTESRLSLCNLNIYVPRDERFSQAKFSDFIEYAFRSLGQVLTPEIKTVFDKTSNEFNSFQDVLELYEDQSELPNARRLDKLKKCIPWEPLRRLFQSHVEWSPKFPVPDVIREDRSAGRKHEDFGWRTDEEFAREMLAGVNPVVIRRLEEFPPASKLDPDIYGNQTSSITREQIEKNMNWQTVDEAMMNNKLFILDHHDALMPYLRRINSTATKTYATRTLLFLQDDSTLKPLAIELSLPHPQGAAHGAISQVYTPAEQGLEGSVWQLAKAYAAVNDSGYHQLISHWLNTHAVIEPFVIATNRQLSVLHPIYKLLQPHFRDTMNINALARHILINAGGIVEFTVFPSKYAMEMSAVIYKNWIFQDHALPTDLLKRGMAIADSSHPQGLKLLIPDYPYAVDGLEIWSAIQDWADEYCSFYYHTDEMVQSDTELQSWWAELRNIGHGDLNDKPWWPEMQTRAEVAETCTIIIWTASALHAALNFGQYPYAGYLPNRPTISRRFMPQPGSPEYAELENNPDSVFLETITAQLQTLIGISLIEILSTHFSNEIYLGQRDSPEWTSDIQARQAFERFREKLVHIEKRIADRNNDKRLKNRNGPVKVPYTLLYPNTSDVTGKGGLTGMGIPNSVSI